MKRNLEVSLESSQSNVNTDEIPGTSGQKRRKQKFRKNTTKTIFLLDSLSLGMSLTLFHCAWCVARDEHDKPFCTKAITIIDNFKNSLGDIDKSQFLKAISVIDKLSPINFSDKCCGKFSMYLTKFFFL